MISYAANPKPKSVVRLGIFTKLFVSFDSDFEYGVLSLIHTQASYNLNLIMEKDFLGAWGLGNYAEDKVGDTY